MDHKISSVIEKILIITWSRCRAVVMAFKDSVITGFGVLHKETSTVAKRYVSSSQ